MSATETKLSRRLLFRAVATSELPMPVDISTYERPDLDAGMRQWAGIRLEDNAPESVEEWATALGAFERPQYGSVIESPNAKPFRAYAVDVTLAGWPVEVCSYVDTEVVKP